jgi:xylulokinase
MSELLIGVDLGTSGTSGVLARPDGEVLATAEKDHEVSMPKPGWVEHDAEEDWWGGFVAVCSELLESAGDDDSVAAVCVSGIAPTLFPAGEDGRPLRPAILYGVDTRASEEVEELTEKYGNGKIIEVCGNPLTAGTDWSTISEVVEPDPKNREVYDELYPATRPMSHVLADIQTREEL